MLPYACYYCEEKFNKYCEIIQHISTEHQNEIIKYKEIELDFCSGKTGYRTKTLNNIKPISHILSLAADNKLLVKKKPNENQVFENSQNESCPLNETSDTSIELTDYCETSFETQTVPTGCKVINDIEVKNDSEVKVNDIDEIYNAIPAVIQTLKEYDQLELYRKWCCLVAENKFPMENICYLLFLDVVEWFSNCNSSQMRYLNENTINFWRVGYRLFHGKFLRFMSGPKNAGDIISGRNDIGDCSTSDSSINFAVPSRRLLAKDSLEPIYPGVLVDTIKNLAEQIGSTPIKIGIDGKKIARGQGKDMGDIDCWGFEPMPTLKDRKKRYKEECDLTANVYILIDNMDSDYIPTAEYTWLTVQMKETVRIISGRIRDLRENLVKLNQGIEKFINLGECEKRDWKKSRFAPVISSLKVNKYDVVKAIEDALRIMNRLLYFIASMNGKAECYSESGYVDLSRQNNCNQLKTNNATSNTRHIKQRTDQWHEVRNKALVTGSTCNAATGLGKLKDQQTHYDRVINGKEPNIPSEVQLQNMEYGTKHEVDSIATLVGKFLPAYFPDLQYFEEGFSPIAFQNKPYFLVVSPDGSLRDREDSEPSMMLEIKCKTQNKYTTDVFYTIPPYYIPQLLCEMKAYLCTELLFTCWSPQSSTILKVEFDSEIWEAIWNILCETYGPQKTKRPTRFPDNIKDLRNMVKNFQFNNVKLIAEIPSCKAIIYDDDSSQSETTTNSTPYMSKKSNGKTPTDSILVREDVLSCFHHIQQWQKSTYDLCRTTASEILVFMANDLDRRYHAEITNSHPIAYALKGTSMSNECFSEMVWHVIEICEEMGLRVLATSSDGQWHKFGVRDRNCAALTIYQLQKDTWANEKSKQKNVIISKLKKRYIVNDLNDIKMDKIGTSVLVHGHVKDKALQIFKCPRRYSEIDVQIVTSTPLSEKSANADLDLNANYYNENNDIVHQMNDRPVHPATPVENYQIHESFELENISSVIENAYSVLFADDLPANAFVNGPEYYKCTAEDDFRDDQSVNQDSSLENFRQPLQLNELCTISSTENHCTLADTSTGELSENIDGMDNRTDVLLLNYLQSVESSRKKWFEISGETFFQTLKNPDILCKEMTKNELLLCLHFLKDKCKVNVQAKKSWKKQKLSSTLTNALDGNNDVCSSTPKRKQRSPLSLKKLVLRKIQSFSKDTLVSVVCEDMWENVVSNWRKDVPTQYLSTSDQSFEIKWFSKPHRNEYGNVRFHFTDSSHILTCLRTKICTSGITGLRQEAWIKAATSEETNLNIAIVVECIDKQNVAFAKRIFGEDVETFMLNNNYTEEARFVHVIRNWYEAEDCAGISADERCMRRLKLRHYLLERSKLNFSSFPYKTQYIGGIPVVTFEALLVHLERKLQIYGYLESRNGYNARALGTQEVEQFFSTLRDLDPSGLGTPKPDDLPSMIAKAAYLDNIRLNPVRGFHMATAASSVYPEPAFINRDKNDDEDSDSRLDDDCILIRDNYFDTSGRVRVKSKRKSGSVSGPECPAKRQRGVRQYHVSDESKILAHVRKGLQDI